MSIAVAEDVLEQTDWNMRSGVAQVDADCSAASSTLEIARQYLSRGWTPIPVPHKGKNPARTGWQHMRLADSDLPIYFGSVPANIGVLLGNPSHGLVDVDLDHPLAEEFAREFLPATGAIFGRQSKPASHWLYYVTDEIETKKHTSQAEGTIVEIRSTGAQTVFPGSVHPSGELIEWACDGQPAIVTSQELREAVAGLAEAVRSCSKDLQVPAVSRPPQLPSRRAKRLANFILNSEVTAVRDAAPGARNDTLNTAAFTLGRLVGGGHCDNVAVEQALLQAAESVGLGRREAAATIRSGLQAGMKEPRHLEVETPDQPARETSTPVKSLPTILIDTDEYRVASQTIGAIATDPDLFQRGTMLVRVLRGGQPKDGIVRPDGSPTIQAVPRANLRERMTRYAVFVRNNKLGQEVPTHPAQWLVSAVDARGEWPGVRHLAGVSDSPVLRGDGSVWQTPGYDPQTGVLFESLHRFPPIHPVPTIDHAREARDILREVVCDFVFESEHHLAAWLAALLTPLARFAFEGPAPLFLIDANVRGAGKGLLAQTIGRIVLGREMPVSSYAHDSEEMRKRITAIAIAGDRMVLLDNLEGSFGNDALDRALTSTRWKDRILGRSEEIDLPLMPVWYATGNNVIVGADTARRLIHIRLDVLDERPEERTGFRHPNLIAWIAEHRPRLLTAALTILSAYCRAGSPDQRLTPFGSFEGWSDLVRQAVVWVGLPDPCVTRKELAESADTTADTLTQLVNAWKEFDTYRVGVVVSDMLGRLYPPDRQYIPSDAAAITMRAALENLVGCPPGKAPTPRQVGNRLRQFRRRVVDGCFLDSTARDQHGAKWKLHTLV